MRISDWSSDVCSSDLLEVAVAAYLERLAADRAPEAARHVEGFQRHDSAPLGVDPVDGRGVAARSEERRVGKELSVRVDLGGRRIIKKKKQQLISKAKT